MNRISCPDCGQIYDLRMLGQSRARSRGAAFDCLRCHTHYTWEEFIEEHNFKLGISVPDYLQENYEL